MAINPRIQQLLADVTELRSAADGARQAVEGLNSAASRTPSSTGNGNGVSGSGSNGSTGANSMGNPAPTGSSSAAEMAITAAAVRSTGIPSPFGIVDPKDPRIYVPGRRYKPWLNGKSFGDDPENPDVIGPIGTLNVGGQLKGYDPGMKTSTSPETWLGANEIERYRAGLAGTWATLKAAAQNTIDSKRRFKITDQLFDQFMLNDSADRSIRMQGGRSPTLGEGLSYLTHGATDALSNAASYYANAHMDSWIRPFAKVMGALGEETGLFQDVIVKRWDKKKAEQLGGLNGLEGIAQGIVAVAGVAAEGEQNLYSLGWEKQAIQRMNPGIAKSRAIIDWETKKSGAIGQAVRHTAAAALVATGVGLPAAIAVEVAGFIADKAAEYAGRRYTEALDKQATIEELVRKYNLYEEVRSVPDASGKHMNIQATSADRAEKLLGKYKTGEEFRADLQQAQTDAQHGYERLDLGDMRENIFQDGGVAFLRRADERMRGTAPLWYSPDRAFSMLDSSRLARREFASTQVARAKNRTGD